MEGSIPMGMIIVSEVSGKKFKPIRLGSILHTGIYFFIAIVALSKTGLFSKVEKRLLAECRQRLRHRRVLILVILDFPKKFQIYSKGGNLSAEEGKKRTRKKSPKNVITSNYHVVY